ncbi:hypothetical protein COCVIDRAFT_29722 [Bipolaris victoriae FI3]|uniref:Uncharacterized protein n=1 Tax=Bipolaris victoriae (strain FI3) TaxID=930091 RepID=W7EBY9_BIPV3|nr:hypothetical protein COCVIDRAFT_29722 [Bipolaris victoriae FI3]
MPDLAPAPLSQCSVTPHRTSWRREEASKTLTVLIPCCFQHSGTKPNSDVDPTTRIKDNGPDKSMRHTTAKTCMSISRSSLPASAYIHRLAVMGCAGSKENSSITFAQAGKIEGGFQKDSRRS